MIVEICGHPILIDECDQPLVERHRWRAHRDRGGHVRVTRQSGTRPNVRNIYLYQEIARPPVGMVVDHINGISSDNRRSNLRACSHTENSWNRPPNSECAVPYKGVARGSKNRFIARIKVAGEIRRLGSFKTPEEAALAYDAAAQDAFGEFAWLNTVHGQLNAKIARHDHA